MARLSTAALSGPPPANDPSPSWGEAPICVRVEQAMRLLDIGKTKLYELLASGDLEAIHIGRRTLIMRDSIDDLVERSRGRGPAQSAG